MDALQKLADMAWPLLDPIARDEMIADQFLNELDSHESRWLLPGSDALKA